MGDFSDFFETLFGQRGRAGGQQQGTRGGFDFDLGSIFNRGRSRTQTASPQRGTDIEQPIDVSLQDAFSGVERSFTLQTEQACPTCGGSGLKDDNICPTCRGAGSVSKTKRLDVKIPAGVKEGSRIRIAGEGNPGAAGGPKGDVYLVVHLLPDPRFRREGDDLYTEVNVPLTKLVLGGEIEVPTIKGRLTATVPPGSQNGRTLRLGGQGMPQLRGGKRGDLYVKLSALLPTHLNDKQRDLFQQLAQAGA
jgi:DnaJ-class molecular chaperone